MYQGLNHAHSGWAYLVVIFLVIAVINAIIGLTGKKEFTPKDRKLSLFALIFSHIQFLIGIVLYYFSPAYHSLKANGMGGVDATSRLLAVEHPLTMIIALVLITIGWSKHKKKATSEAKFKSIAIFYGIALVLVLSRIPWAQWF